MIKKKVEDSSLTHEGITFTAMRFHDELHRSEEGVRPADDERAHFISLDFSDIRK